MENSSYQHSENNRGHHADTPIEIPPRGWWQIAKRIFNQIGEDHVTLVSAGVAFYGFLALMPALSAGVSLYGLIMSPQDVQDQLNSFLSVLPQTAHEMLSTILEGIVNKSRDTLSISLIVSILISLWSANKGMIGLFQGLNIVYNENDERGFFKKRLMTYGFTFLAFVSFGVCMIMIVGISALVGQMGLPPLLAAVMEWIRWPILAGVFIVALSLLYKYAPYRNDPEFKWASLGAIVATILWLILSVAFSVYVDNFGSYDEMYGSLAAVVIAMLWIFLTSVLILVGAEINAEMEHQTTEDTTVGPEEPMGERDAHYADHPPDEA